LTDASILRRFKTLHLARRIIVLSKPELRVLSTFREYLMGPGRMLCFSGPNLERDRKALELLSDKKLLEKERFKGAYSLTQAGFAAMKDYEDLENVAS
jgi:predicted transcriptional regulator